LSIVRIVQNAKILCIIIPEFYKAAAGRKNSYHNGL